MEHFLGEGNASYKRKVTNLLNEAESYKYINLREFVNAEKQEIQKNIDIILKKNLPVI